MEQVHDPESIRVLDEDECWDVLRANAFGHLAYAPAGRPNIVPINYMAHEGRLLFRTAEGSKLLGIVVKDEVAFEVDEIDDGSARTVIVTGRAHQLSDAETDAVDELPLHPWVLTLKFNVVAITPERVSGRAFRLAR
jgi:nitroimidazol reductase NimA-like FMN-containing flavoprotein (pyridoxamine 5'-phosphate oxidase superfamily)